MYGVFDERAEKRRVFKVETIGDCYVAVCGLPEPRKNHAIAMVLFAKDIIDSMSVVTTQLENQLGPGTSDLAIRIGVSIVLTCVLLVLSDKDNTNSNIFVVFYCLR